MEGSRNERSILITISYIIGFVTAFILFTSDKNIDTYEVADITQPGAVMASQSEATELDKDVSVDYLAKPFALASSDGKNIFYCEFIDQSRSCSAHIYSKDTETVQKVYLSDQELTISEDLLNEVKWTENGLTIVNIVSINPLEPWYLISPNTPIDLQ